MKRNTLILACLVTLLLALSGSGALAGEPRNHAASVDPTVLLDLLDDQDVDGDRILRLLLGLDDDEKIDGEQVVRFLLGIDESDEIDREQIVRLLHESAGTDAD